MIFDIKTNEKITSMAHQGEFDLWRRSISPSEFQEILKYLTSFINAKDSFSSRELIPAGAWQETVFEPVYFKSCFMDEKLSGLFVELIIWHVVQSRADEWFYRNEDTAGELKDRELKASKFYFRKNKDTSVA